MVKTKLALLSTGGTIEKTYDEFSGLLENRVSVLDVMLASLALPTLEIERVPLMNKDSMTMSEADHLLIAEAAVERSRTHDAVVVLHGTDRLSVTGDRIFERWAAGGAPVVMTGAMVPYALRRTDALQNLTEAMMAAQLLAGGVYVVMHGTVLPFPGIRKDRERGRFVRVSAK